MPWLFIPGCFTVPGLCLGDVVLFEVEDAVLLFCVEWDECFEGDCFDFVGDEVDLPPDFFFPYSFSY